jgi:nucleotide-binding universal stress UspA family protein
MSLESALEEERLDVVKILEQTKEKSPRSASKSPSTAYRRPVSLILNDNEHPIIDSDEEDTASGRRARSPPGKRRASDYYDPLDPYSGEGYYYSSSSLWKGSTVSKAMAGLSIKKETDESKLKGRSKSQSSSGRRPSSGQNEMDFSRAYRRLSHSNISRSEGSLGDLYRTSSGESRLAKDYDVSDSSDSDDSDASSSDSGASDDELDSSVVKPRTSNQIKSLLGAAEEERKAVASSRFKVKSLLEVDPLPGSAPPPSMADYAAYKRRIIHPNTAFDTDDENDDETAPYTAASEEARDAREAARMEVEISQIQSNQETRRMIRTMKRGNLPLLSDPNTPKLKSFIVASDLSPAATHALEWTIGTVLRDGNVLVIICTFEDDGSGTATALEEERLEATKKLTNTTVKLLKKTRLQVHVVIEVLHCRTPRHVLTEIIDHVNPTLVILGSRGRSAIKGVLLGSFSNYIVERSSVPVMVARKKLKKTKNKGLNVRLSNNLRAGSLSSAKVD